jgi:hypothetical protein
LVLLNLFILAFAAAIIGSIVWFTVRGWVKYPEERGKGGFPFNNQIPGLPPVYFERRDLPEEPPLVIPADRQPEALVRRSTDAPGG